MKAVWTAVLTILAFASAGRDAFAQIGGRFPQPIVQAGHCPTCVQGATAPYAPYTPAGSGFQPWQPWRGPAQSSPPQLHAGYALPQEVSESGWYLGGLTGAVYLEDQTSKAIEPNILRQEEAKFDWNALGGVIIGYRFPMHERDLGKLRMEFETAYRENEVKSLLFNGVEQAPFGEVIATSYMFNLALDFVHVSNWLTPYVGGGVGVVHLSEHIEYPGARFVDSDGVFGYQGMAGASIKLWENVELFTEFRFLGGSKPKFLRVGPPAPPARVRLRSEYNTYNFISGIRINLY